MDWKQKLAEWQQSYPIKLFKPVDQTLLAGVQVTLGKFPAELVSLYEQTNGFSYAWFKILPIENPADLRRTWNGVERANTPSKTSFLEGDTGLLRRFLIFAALDTGRCAVIQRSDETIWYSDETIWYEEDDEIHLLSLNLADFIETCLREVREL